MRANLLMRFAGLALALCLMGTAYAADTYTEQVKGGVVYRIYSDHAVVADVDHNKENVPETVTILSSIGGKTVTEIQGDAFNYQHFTRKDNKEEFKGNVANIKHVFIPNTVTVIGGYSFYEAPNIQDVTIESGSKLTDIRTWAFRDCKSLKKFFIPKTVKNIEKECFRNCSSLTEVVFEEGSQITQINPFTFQNCVLLSSINLPSTVTRLGEEAFKYDRSLKTLPLHDNITVIEQAVFSDCTGVITSVKLPRNIKTIKWSAFEKVPMTSITFPASLENLGPWSFKGTGVRTIYFEYANRAFPNVLPQSNFKWQENGFFSMAFENLNAIGYCNKSVTNVPDFIKSDKEVIEVTMRKVGAAAVSVDASGYATLYYAYQPLIVPNGMTATTYSLTGGKLVPSKVFAEGQTIPAATGVVLQAKEGSYNFLYAPTPGMPDRANVLLGTDEETALNADAGSVYYRLSLDSTNDPSSVGFYWGAPDGAAFTNGAHKAYLKVARAAGAKIAYLLDGTVVGTPTGITSTTINTTDGAAYNLSGQRVDSSYRGIVIVNGRKYIRK